MTKYLVVPVLAAVALLAGCGSSPVNGHHYELTETGTQTWRTDLTTGQSCILWGAEAQELALTCHCQDTLNDTDMAAFLYNVRVDLACHKPYNPPPSTSTSAPAAPATAPAAAPATAPPTSVDELIKKYGGTVSRGAPPRIADRRSADLAVFANGFTIRNCRRELIDNGATTRLYTSDTGPSHVDIPTAQIDHFEKDLSPPPAVTKGKP